MYDVHRHLPMFILPISETGRDSEIVRLGRVVAGRGTCKGLPVPLYPWDTCQRVQCSSNRGNICAMHTRFHLLQK